MVGCRADWERECAVVLRWEHSMKECGEVFGHGSAMTAGREEGWQTKVFGLAGIEGERGGLKQVLPGPTGSQMNVDAARGQADARADFEQTGAQGFDLGRAPGLRQLPTEQVDQVVGGGVQEETESVAQEAVTAEAVGAEAVLELLDAVLALAAIIVESEDRGGTAGAVGDQETQVGTGGGVLGLVADAALMRPSAGAMAEAGKAALGKLGAAIAAF